MSATNTNTPTENTDAEGNGATLSAPSSPVQAVAIAEAVASLAVILDNRSQTVATVRAVGLLTDAEDRGGYAMTDENVAGAVSRARARLAHPDASDAVLDVLATDSAYRVSRQAVSQYRAAWRVVTAGMFVPVSAEDGTDARATEDGVLLAAYAVTTKTGRAIGDRLTAVTASVAGRPVGERADAALRLLGIARRWWLNGGVTGAEDVNVVNPPAPVADATATPVQEDGATDDSAEDMPAPGTVRPSLDVLLSMIGGIPADAAGLSGPQLARVFDALDAAYVALDAHPAAADARSIMHKRDTAEAVTA